MSRPKINPNVKKVHVCITLTPIVMAMAKNKCFRDGKSLSAKIDEMLGAYVCEDFDLGMPASWNAMQSNDNGMDEGRRTQDSADTTDQL